MLIADAGSTKTQWSLVDRKGVSKLTINTDGINALITPIDRISQILDSVKIELCGNLTDEVVVSKLLKYPLMPLATINEVYFYGAGCATESAKARIKSELKKRFPNSGVDVESDMVAAARAICGKTAGVACILGTGSNSCLYDGRTIIENTPSMGYVLGDEGGGVAIGRRLIADAFKGLMPSVTLARFKQLAGIGLEDIINNVYSRMGSDGISPNTYIASYTKIAADMIDDEYIRDAICDEFKRFLSRNVCQYRRVKSLKIGFIGSVAVNFSDILTEAVNSFGFKMGKIMASPLEGLARYHSRTSFPTDNI